MGVLYALESIRTPVLDKIMLIISELGGEAPFLIIAIAVFWCIDKRKGYYLMTVGFFGMILNQFLKILCCVPRPWVKDPDFTIVEPARAGATGYSFPSGHTQNAVALYGGIARCTGSRLLRVVCIVLAVLIAFSRMYLGVHTPLDVGVSLVIATVLVLALYPLMEEVKRRPAVQTYVIAGMVVCRMSCWALREVEPVSAVTAVGETAWEEKIGSMLMGAYASTPEYTCTPSRRMSE